MRDGRLPRTGRRHARTTTTRSRPDDRIRRLLRRARRGRPRPSGRHPRRRVRRRSRAPTTRRGPAQGPRAAGSLLAAPAPRLDATEAFSRREPAAVEATLPARPPRDRRAGSRIGPYKLLQADRRGGHGRSSTWPSRSEPVRRRVALKVIKPGMDSGQVIARFEAERQALALMDHPNIAKVLDAGATDARPAVLRHGAGQGRADHRVLRRGPADAPRAARAVRPGLPGDPARPPEGDHPPRHQAVERAGDAPRRPAGAQGDRLRRRQGDRPAADRADALHPARRDRRHARVHEPRAGRDERALDVDTRSDVYSPGRAPLRAAHRHDAAGAGEAPARRRSPRCSGGSARRSRRGRARGSPSSREALPSIAAQRRTEPAKLRQAGPRRARLDRDEGPGEGPDPPLRDGQRPGPRHRALPRRRARGGLPAVGVVPAAEVRPAGTARPWRRPRRSRYC